MHAIIDKKFYLGPKFGTLINRKWITIFLSCYNGPQGYSTDGLHYLYPCHRYSNLLHDTGSLGQLGSSKMQIFRLVDPPK
jgi:hypothetical protein